MRPSVRQWLLLVVATVGLGGSMAVAEAIISRYLVRLDLTPNKAYTLAEQSRRVLQDLHQDVKIIAFLRSDDARNADIEDLLWRVRTVSPHVQYSVVDINRNPAVARQYGVNADAALVVEVDGRRKVFSNPSEPLLIGAILQVTRPERKRIYVLTGHGERSITDSDRRSGFSTARVALANEFYDVETLSLLSGVGVPADASVVMIPGPRADLLPAELLALDAYLSRGGSLLVMIDPFQAASLAAFLRTYHIAVGDDVVVDPENRLFAGDFLTMVIPGLSPRNRVSAGLGSPPLFSQARSVSFVPDPSGRFSGEELLESGGSSWRTTDRDVLQIATASFMPGRDVRGPVPVGVAEYALPAGGPGGPARLMILGDSDFANNFFIEYLGNKDLLVNSVNWLAHDEQLVGVRPQQQQPGVNQFFVSARQGKVAFWLGTVVQPAIFLGLGLVVFLRRRFTG